MIQSRKILQMAQKPTAKHTLVSDPQLGQLLQAYEGGLRAMQEHKYDTAKPLLQTVVTGANRKLADRALCTTRCGSCGALLGSTRRCIFSFVPIPLFRTFLKIHASLNFSILILEPNCLFRRREWARSSASRMSGRRGRELRVLAIG